MLRRPGNRTALLLMVALTVVCIVVYEGNYLTGETLRQKLGLYNQVLCIDSRQGLNPATVRPPETSKSVSASEVQSTTPVWQNPVYAKRRHLSENMCSSLRGGGVLRLTRYGNTSYCVVPKVGCTFWLNVFRFLHGDTGNKNLTSPFNIPRIVTHYGARKHMPYFSTNTSFAPHHLVDDLRFMFVRDPYSRLWSAYVDKFLLVDYWRTEGKNIVKLRPNKDNKTMCARDISFKEFVEFVATRSNPRALNEHWKPIYYLCSPCLYQPHVIGKIETFSQDSRYVLQLMNSSWILDSYDHEKHVYQEMDMLITYNFQIIKAKHYINCTNATDLGRRLWRTFQINGYIPMAMKFPDVREGVMNVSRFRALAYDAYKNRPKKSSAEWRHQREQAMVDAFRDIPLQTLEKLKKIYKEDFKLFGYDPQPDHLFAHRKRTPLNNVS